jgi:thiol-disulfide isomerase/thioredoxin
MSEQEIYLKYLKYKTKYFNLKNQNKLNKLIGGAPEKTQIYLFKAEWCGHCKGFKPTWEKLQKDLSNKYEFVTMDSEKNKEEMTKWDIKGFPTIIKLVGSKAEEYMGPRDEKSLKEFLG